MTRNVLATSSSVLAFAAALLAASAAAAQGAPITATNGATPASSVEAQSTNPDAARHTNTPVVRTGDTQLAPADPTTPPNVNDAPSNAARVGPAEAAEIVVTGSRITVAGYKQPTPVTVVNEAVLQRDSRPTIGDSIRELPQVGQSASPSNTQGAGNIVAGVTGLDTVNLRNLGVTRTLVLFDGQRVVQSNVTGQIDIGTIPTALVQRIDVVTAGASAAWGSDAVSGVVNLILNKNFDGLRASGEYANTYAWDRKNYRLQGAFGKGFADGRGRIILAANYFDAPESIFANQRSWNHYRQLVNNPAYTATNDQPRLIHADNVNLSGATTGGLIIGACRTATGGTCPAASQLNTFSLLNQQFVGQSATLAAYPTTNVSGQVASNADILQAALNNLAVQYRTFSAFGYTSYELTDTLKASLQLNYGTTFSRNNSVPYIRIGATGAVPININNPFLPQAVRDQMTAQRVEQIQVATTNITNADLGSLSYDTFRTNAIGVPVATTKRSLKRAVFSLDGKIGSDWTWNAYGQRGQVRVYQTTESNIIIGNYNKAVNAVRNGAGQIVCAVNADTITTNDDPACVPLNILGTGNASAAALRYVNVTQGQNFQIQRLTENVAAASAQGKLPFGLKAGSIAMALGAEYRFEKGVIDNDDGAKARNVYPVANFPSFRGKYDVKEAFLEFDVPLIDQGFVDNLSFNTAGRVTHYSTSGTVVTWKVGLTSQLNDSIRLRGTVSRDIRAPNLNELFSTGLQTLSSAIDPRTGNSVSIFTFASGNAALKPEKARTISGGIVLSPTFARGFNLSVDYYNIDLKDVIASINSTEVLSRCNGGEAGFCSQLVFNGPNGALSQINTFPLNLASLKTSGIDVQADYTMPALGGSLQYRILGNYITVLRQNQLGNVINAAGAIGPDNAFTGVPRARFTGSITYLRGGLSLTAQTRFLSAAKLVYTWTSKDVDDNHVPAIAYVDLRGSIQLTKAVQIFATIDNLLNQDPPNVAAGPTQGQTSYYFTPIAGQVYDAIGRQYRAGIRVKF